MNKAEAKERLAPREYFQAVIDKMKERGFEFLAWVTMNTDQNTYHVDFFGYTQESRIFFRVPEKASIVMLDLTQHIGQKDREEGTVDWNFYEAYWRGFVDYSYDSKEWIHAEVRRQRDEERPWDEDLPDLPGLVLGCLDQTFFREGGSSSQASHFHQRFEPEYGRYDYQNLPDPTGLTAPFGEMLEIVMPYLYARFNDLQVTDYAPHYTFREQEPDFWAKFPIPRLQRAVKRRIWGSDFQR